MSRSMQIVLCRRPASTGTKDPVFGESFSVESVAIVFEDTTAFDIAEGLALKKVDRVSSRVQLLPHHARTDGQIYVCLEANQPPFANRQELFDHPGPITFFHAKPVMSSEVERLQQKIAR